MSYSDITSHVKSAVSATPQIYAYTTPEIRRHDGWTKIGYTERDVRTRIEEQTHTADIRFHLEWSDLAQWSDGSGSFMDTDFHNYLHRLGVQGHQGTEWFHISPDDAHSRFNAFRQNHGIISESPAPRPYRLRREQEQAVLAALDYSRLHEHGEFLWNAKPRFGKTLASYDLAKRLGAVNVLIVTNRPAIANSWYDDYAKFLGTQSGYRFVSSVEGIADKELCLPRRDFQRLLLDDSSLRMIEFVSLQDLKGSVWFGGPFNKLEEVAHLDWDLLIVDEAHEGVDTYKTDVAFDHINRKFTLHLSGTPFKAIANDKFPEDAIFNWTYADEQQAKRDWDNPDLPNPYADMPQLNMFTYQMSDIIRDKVAHGIQLEDDGSTTDYAFDLNEFFATKPSGSSGTPTFLHNEEVDKFLDALTTQTKYPFSTPQLRDELRHTLWMLDRVDSARALARKLRNHPVFKNYEIVLAAGDGRLDDDDETRRSYDRVVKAIATHDRTITLSVGQLTTGVTIPEWTAVLMLSNMKSPALYMQAAFRAQNPCLFRTGSSYQRKKNAYVFDFDPARTLTIFEQFANDLSAETTSGNGTSAERKQHVRRLLNFFPVIGEDPDGKMTELDAARVLSIPRTIHAHEVVHRGFMSDFLFQNISNIFRAPSAVVDILDQFEPVSKSDSDLKISTTTADDLSLDDDGQVNVSDDIIIGTEKDVFGSKKFDDVGAHLTQEITQSLSPKEHTGHELLPKELDALRDKFSSLITEPLLDAAEEHYGPQMKPSQRAKIARQIKADADIEFNRQQGDYTIERNRINLAHEKALETAQTAEDVEKIDAARDQQLEKARDGLRQALLDTSRTSLIEQTSRTVVREMETARREEVKESIETGIRDHLRGFSRTISSFLMAYGDEDTTLENFDTIIPADVFHEVTSITVEQFHFLRDGGDYTDDDGKPAHFDGKLFDPIVFNDSVREFISLRTKLANYFDKDQEEDIFDYVPPQKTNQIFTPRPVVIKMIDLFEQENPGCFDDPHHTFADLYMKSGLFITEIVKRLFNSEKMKSLFPDDRQRLDHIFRHQVFGVAPSEIIYQIATHFILGYHGEVGDITNAHFAMADTARLAKEGKLDDYIQKTFGDNLGGE